MIDKTSPDLFVNGGVFNRCIGKDQGQWIDPVVLIKAEDQQSNSGLCRNNADRVCHADRFPEPVLKDSQRRL